MTMSVTTKWITLFFLFVFSNSALADGYFKVAGMYNSSRIKAGGTTVKSNRTLLDLGGGYVTAGGWSFGALYSTSQHDPNSGADIVAYGPTVGWMQTGNAGAYIQATYLIVAERDDGSEGKGTQFDFGYRIPLGSVSFAPQLSFKNYEYDKGNGGSLSPKTKESLVDPYFVLFMNF